MNFSEHSWHNLTLALSLSILISPAALLKGTVYSLFLIHYWEHRSLRWHWHPPRLLFPISDGFLFPLHIKHFPPEVHDFRLHYLLSLLITSFMEFPSFIHNWCWPLTHVFSTPRTLIIRVNVNDLPLWKCLCQESSSLTHSPSYLLRSSGLCEQPKLLYLWLQLDLSSPLSIRILSKSFWFHWSLKFLQPNLFCPYQLPKLVQTSCYNATILLSCIQFFVPCSLLYLL